MNNSTALSSRSFCTGVFDVNVIWQIVEQVAEKVRAMEQKLFTKANTRLEEHKPKKVFLCAGKIFFSVFFYFLGEPFFPNFGLSYSFFLVHFFFVLTLGEAQTKMKLLRFMSNAKPKTKEIFLACLH